MKKLDLAALLVVALVAHSLHGATFHIAPGGDDSNSGSAARPFATLQRAQRAVRALKQAGKLDEPVTVSLHGGSYPLREPVVFDSQDSGTATAPITYAAAPGERPVLKGGRRIAGWRKFSDRLWVVDLPEVKAGAWRFNQLFVNGESQSRARLPHQGFSRVAGCPDGTIKTGYHKGSQRFEFKPGDIRADWTNLQDVEVIVYHFWTDSHLLIKSVDSASNLVTFAYKAGKVFTDDFTTNGARYVVKNVFEGLDAPGEWYLDRHTGALYYMPKAGKEMSQVEVVAPELPVFMRLEGSPKQREFVEHLAFRGLTFQFNRFELPPGNSNEQQGSSSVPAAITLTGARHCRFENCEFRNLGTWAIEAGKGCTENAFLGNEIHHIAAGGFRVNGGTERDHPLERTSNNLIADNHLHDYGRVYPSAVGILLMHTEGNSVVHNHIHHGYYTGVSVGWVWNYARSVSWGNRIEFNHFHDIGQGLLSDMGGIYTLGVSPGTVIRNNLIHDVDANQYGGWGIYHDQASSYLLVESNVVYRTKFAAFNIHFSKEVTVRNNIFALGRLEQLNRTKSEPHKSVFFENNIVYWKTGELYHGNWKDESTIPAAQPKGQAGTATLASTFDCDWNLYFNPASQRGDVKFAGDTWAEWQQRGKDTHSMYADPLFVDPEHADFRLKLGSPALMLGFQPIDLSQVGPRVSTGPGKGN